MAYAGGKNITRAYRNRPKKPISRGKVFRSNGDSTEEYEFRPFHYEDDDE